MSSDLNASSDVFVRDRWTSTTRQVSVSSTGIPGNSDSGVGSGSSTISADGQFAAFQSEASNLVPGDTNGWSDIFVHDTATAATSRVTVSSTGAQALGGSINPAVSANGRFVAFASGAANLAPGDRNNTQDVFVHDRVSGTTTLVSVSSNEKQANSGLSYPTGVSRNGRYVAFFSWASNLVPGDTNDTQDVFVRDRRAGTTRRVSVSSAGVQGNSESRSQGMSADGRYIGFYSSATNLVPGDTNGSINGGGDVFVHDQVSGVTERVSVTSGGAQANGASVSAAMSPDGRFVAFTSDASNLSAIEPAGISQVYLHDRKFGSTRLLSVSDDGSAGNDFSFSVAVSATGRYVAFSSLAANLVSNDTNVTEDIFVRDRGVAPR